MTLQTSLASLSIEAGLLETERNALKATVVAQLAEIQGLHDEIDDLETALAECLGDPPPPDPPPPPPPGDWPTNGIDVKPGDDIAQIVGSNSAGATFRFAPGTYNLTGPLPLKAGNYYYGADPNNRPKFVGGGAGKFPFATGTVSGVTFKGIAAEYFGPANADQGAGMIDSVGGGTEWRFEDCDFGYSNRSVISGGKTWDMVRCYVHHGGKYSVQGAMRLVEDCEWSHSGRNDIPGVAPWTASNDKGGSKFVKSDGLKVVRLYTHHHGWTGLWCDIQNENIHLEDVRSEDNARHGISIEVSYGPATIIRPVVKRCGTAKKSGETNIPVPAGILISMSPDVTVIDPLVEDCYNGIIVRQWKHPQVTGTVGNADKTRLGVQNVLIEGGQVTRSKQFDGGVHGSQQAGVRPTKNIHYKDVTFDASATFCGPRDIP